MKKKLIVILGPTASGKSELAVKLAKKFNGQIVSADSRQVYRGMDVGSGKVPRDKSANSRCSKPFSSASRPYFYKGVRHYLLDVASPKRKFTVAQYQKMALKALNKIHKERKIPILCGGTGFYIQAVVEGILIPEIKPDWKLRKDLEKKSNQELFSLLKKLDLKRAKNIDRYNPRRLIRAIEISIKTKKPVPKLRKKPLPHAVLIIGVKKEKKELSSLIKKRLLKRLKNQEMIKEVKRLRRSGLSWKRLEEFGLEYRFVAQYLQGKISCQEMVNSIQKESEHFAKRQMTWFNHQIDDFTAQNSSKKNFGEFKRNKNIKWVKNYSESKKLVKNFLF